MEDQGNLNRIAINATIHGMYTQVQEEFYRNIRLGDFGKEEYPMMQTMESIMRAQARGHTDLLKKYDDDCFAVRKKYGNATWKQWEMHLNEAGEIKALLEGLMYDLGITRVDERREMPEPVIRDYSYGLDGRQLVYEMYMKRLSENRNLNILFTGKIGGGKSYASLSAAQFIDSTFTLSRVVFKIPDFIRSTQSGLPSQAIILDEAGVAASSREALNKSVKAIGKVIQSTRYKKLATFFTLPNVMFLDKQVRLMLDIVFSHDEGQRQGEFQVGYPVVSDDNKEVEFRPMKYAGKIVASVFFPLPSPALITEYEKLRDANSKEQLDELQDELEPKTKESDGRGKNPNSLKNLKPFRGDEDD